MTERLQALEHMFSGINQWTVFQEGDKKLRKIANVSSEESLGEMLEMLDFADTNLSIRVFRQGIVPKKKDPSNHQGCKLVLRGVPSAQRFQLWSRLIVALVTEHFGDPAQRSDVHGLVLTSEGKDTDNIQLWLAKRHLPDFHFMKYKCHHKESIQTQVDEILLNYGSKGLSWTVEHHHNSCEKSVYPTTKSPDLSLSPDLCRYDLCLSPDLC
eukprot:gene19324-952_t